MQTFKKGDRVNCEDYGTGFISRIAADAYLVVLDKPRNCYFDAEGNRQEPNGVARRFLQSDIEHDIEPEESQAWINGQKRKPLFITQDGVEIYENDYYSSVWKDKRSNNTVTGHRASVRSGKNPDILYFSTREKAQAYRDLITAGCLFITKDCMPIYIGDIFYYVNPENKDHCLIGQIIAQQGSGTNNAYLYFSTYNAALAEWKRLRFVKKEEKPVAKNLSYAELRNMEVLSINDVATIFASVLPNSSWDQNKAILKLVKQKLANKQ